MEDPDVAAYFDQLVARTGNAKQSANWVMGDLSAFLNQAELDISIAQQPGSADHLGQLIRNAWRTIRCPQKQPKPCLKQLCGKTAAMWIEVIEHAGSGKQMNDSG